MFAKLGENYPELFHTLFNLGKGKLENFWSSVKRTGGDKLKGHPMTLDKGWEGKKLSSVHAWGGNRIYSSQ